MTALRFFLVVLIFAGASAAWAILGGTIEYRTASLDRSLTEQIDARWGPAGLVQPAPAETLVPLPATIAWGPSGLVQPAPAETAGVMADADKSDIQVRFDHNDRYMGLVWFSTYTVDFSGTYTVGGGASAAAGSFCFTLPRGAPVFENLRVELDGQPSDAPSVKDGNRVVVPIPADGKEHAITVAYRTQGRDRWEYDLSRGGDAAMVKNFTLVATTNFRDIDYPKGSASPTPAPAADIDGGKRAEWHFENRSTRQRLGVEMPSRENAGPIAARMAFHAPVSLFFFFTVMFTIVVLRKVPLHPMHYLFISAGFFAFHILMAYLVDKIDIHYAFWICAAVSVFLVVSYTRLVAGVKFAVLYVGLAQLVYLIGFSYAFFWKGWTGLTVVIIAILTLFFLMQATGRLIWNEVFARPAPVRVAPPPAPAGAVPAPPPGGKPPAPPPGRP